MRQVVFLRVLLFIVFMPFFRGFVTAQPIDTSTKTTFLVLPLVYYTPETRWAFGVASAYVFQLPGEEIPASQLQAGGAYTLNKQLLTYVSYRLYRQEWLAFGEVGYYKYTYRFYGSGANPTPDFELYDVDFPRLRVNIMKRVRKNVYLGGTYWLEDYQVTKVEPGGLLDEGGYRGSEGSFTSGLGPSVIWDARNSIFYPTKGWYAEGWYQFYNKALGSDFRFRNLELNVRYFKQLHASGVLALDSYLSSRVFEVPFQYYSQLGGNRRMRGYFEGQYRDRNLFTTQAEYRQTFGQSRWGAVAFVGHGVIYPSLVLTTPARTLFSYGAGVRFAIDKQRRLNLRLDAGFGKNTSGYYFTVGEAF